MRLTILLLVLIPCSVIAQPFDTTKNHTGISIHARFSQYDTSRYNYLVNKKQYELTNTKHDLSVESSKWEVSVQSTDLNDGTKDYVVQFLCKEGELTNASVAIDFRVNDWSIDNYLLMPGAVYNGNRFVALPSLPYMPFFQSPSQMGIDKPIIISEQPHLNIGSGVSRIQDRSGSMSIPSVGFFSPKSKSSTWLLFTQGNELGDYGVNVDENNTRTTAVISLQSPLVREIERHEMSNNIPSVDQPALFKKGSVLTFKFKLRSVASKNINDLFSHYAYLKSTYFPVPEKQNIIPFSSCFTIQQRKFNQFNWMENSFYKVGIIKKVEEPWAMFLDWQIGWVGGMQSTLPLLMEGNDTSVNRVIRQLDWLFSNGVSPSGYFYGAYHKKKFIGTPLYNKPYSQNLALARANADGVYYVFKHLMLMKRKGLLVKKLWEDGNFKVLEAQLNTWKKYGQLGQYVNHNTGELIVGNTTSGAIFPAALCLAFDYSGKKEYLNYAEAILDYYYENFIVKGITCGGPNDAVQSLDSESSYGLLESIMTLYEYTQNPKWLDRAVEMGYQFSSWVVGYDYKFPPSSDWGKMDMRSTGAVYANSQNKTAPAGICTHSGIALLKLYRATRNKYFLNLLVDIAHTLPQFMSIPTRPIPCYEEGWLSERCNMNDWNEGLGQTFCYSSWAESSLMLSYTELPSIYVNLDNLDVFCIDHVTAKIIKSTGKEIVLEIVNPTSYPAVLKIFGERKKQADTALFTNASLNWQKVEVKAGKTIQLKLKR